MYSVDTALNALWAIFCLAAVVCHFKEEFRRNGSANWTRLCRTLAVLLACLALFPCVSASDDSVRLQFLNSSQTDQQHPNQAPTKKTPDRSLATLVRLLEALESVQISVVWSLLVALGFFALAVISWRSYSDMALPMRPGRAPPVFAVSEV